jgi:hypothetical protein
VVTAEEIPIDGVRAPVLSFKMLIKGKSTHREEDRADLGRLRDLLEMKRKREGLARSRTLASD